MADRDVVKKTYLTEREAAQLSEWAADVNKSESTLLREAVLEYLDYDRTARIEEKVDRVLSHLETDSTHTHKDSSTMNQGSNASEKARAIVSRLQQNHDEVMKADAVDRAIEDIAGIDDRTKRKYKTLFRKRGILFEHPGEPPLWTTEADNWLEWIQTYAELNGREGAEDEVEKYPAVLTSAVNSGYHIELEDSEVKI